jgi:cytochrome P450
MIPASEFDPAALSSSPDPYAMLAAVRHAGPAFLAAGGYLVVTGYAAADALLRDRRFRSGPIGLRYRADLPPGAAQDELSHRINFLDPPEHTRVRALVSRAFTPARVRAMRPWVQAQTVALLDATEARRSAGDAAFDLRGELAHALPSLVISEMLGVPEADRAQLTQWTEAVTPLLALNPSPEQRERGLEASARFFDYAEALIAERRRAPREDLLSAMLAPAADGEALMREELLSLVVTLYSAGHRTTRDLFANGLFTLLSHPAAWQALAADPARVPATVNEFLRFETPTLYVARVPLEDADVLGTPVHAFTPVLVMLAAANRDPAVYADAEHFRIDRADEPAPMSFAVGLHHCLGSALARMETEVMLEAVLRRWPRLRLAETPRWWGVGPFRGLDRLRVVSA